TNSPNVTLETTAVTTKSSTVASGPTIVTSEPTDVTTNLPNVTLETTAVTTKSSTVTADPSTLTNKPVNVTSKANNVTNNPAINVTSEPTTITTEITPDANLTIEPSIARNILGVQVKVKLEENITSNKFISAMKTGLNEAFFEALERAGRTRKKRNTWKDRYEVEILGVERTPNVTSKAVDTSFVHYEDGKIVDAFVAVSLHERLNDNELSAILGYAVLKPVHALAAPPPTPTALPVLLWSLVVTVPSLLLLMIIILMVAYLCRQKKSRVISLADETKKRDVDSLQMHNLAIDLEKGDIVNSTPIVTTEFYSDPSHPTLPNIIPESATYRNGSVNKRCRMQMFTPAKQTRFTNGLQKYPQKQNDHPQGLANLGYASDAFSLPESTLTNVTPETPIVLSDDTLSVSRRNLHLKPRDRLSRSERQQLSMSRQTGKRLSFDSTVRQEHQDQPIKKEQVFSTEMSPYAGMNGDLKSSRESLVSGTSFDSTASSASLFEHVAKMSRFDDISENRAAIPPLRIRSSVHPSDAGSFELPTTCISPPGGRIPNGLLGDGGAEPNINGDIGRHSKYIPIKIRSSPMIGQEGLMRPGEVETHLDDKAEMERQKNKQRHRERARYDDELESMKADREARRKLYKAKKTKKAHRDKEREEDVSKKLEEDKKLGRNMRAGTSHPESKHSRRRSSSAESPRVHKHREKSPESDEKLARRRYLQLQQQKQRDQIERQQLLRETAQQLVNDALLRKEIQLQKQSEDSKMLNEILDDAFSLANVLRPDQSKSRSDKGSANNSPRDIDPNSETQSQNSDIKSHHSDTRSHHSDPSSLKSSRTKHKSLNDVLLRKQSEKVDSNSNSPRLGKLTDEDRKVLIHTIQEELQRMKLSGNE
ncbi:unnamed protein product, partial [Owenia fusiformis]